MTASSDEPPAPSGNSLETYRARRSPDRSPEPVGTVVRGTAGGSLRFVVHKHAARQLHWDLRLEMDGVLRSWAVPKGPSYDMADKRYAVNVEDHPLEYADFEGVIPRGNYGAGGIIIWDRGEWVPLEPWQEGLEKGKLLFELRGYKLHGRWTLVKTKKGERDWLLIKERDEWVRSPGDTFVETSVLSGLTVEELAEGRSPAMALRAAAEDAGAMPGRVDPAAVKLMLADTADRAFDRDGWIFELKLDGYRLLAARTGGRALLLTRNGHDYTAVFPGIARAIEALPIGDCILDGEVVVMDAGGRPSFSRLQQRGRLKSPMEIQHAETTHPATLFAFDLLALDDLDLRALPLRRRKALLQQALPSLGAVRYLDHHERDGVAFLTQVAALGLEGTIAKRADAPYLGGRTDSWLKIKAERTADFVIVGFTAPRGHRSHFGALQIADMVSGTLVYAGRVGTGFDEARLAELHALLLPLARATPPCAGPVTEPGRPARDPATIPETRTTTWCEPVLVCEVRYREWTPDGVLRHPSFLHLRADKDVRDCERQHWDASDIAMPDVAGTEPPAVAPDGPPAPSAPSTTERVVPFTNLGKLYWPQDGYTKGDLVEYYRAIAPWMLPYLRDRPLVMTRFPDGIDGKSFYQKDAPEFAPAWLRTTPIWSTETSREVNYFVCDDLESLLYVANLGSIPLHSWGSRVGSLERPDWCVIDLDPKDAPFADVIRTAVALRALCESIALPSYVKTTGKTGLHVLLPLARQCTWEQTRTLGELLARVVLRDLDDIATITRHVTRRGDKVYLDYLQNRHGQTVVAPFSVRPLPGATVSMPLHWDEVLPGLDPREFTIRTALDRLAAVGDPMLPVIAERVDLQAVLARLAALLA